MARNDGRNNDELRAITFTTGYIIHPEGSVLVECGHTKVICNATVEEKTPPFLKDSGKGWVSAEYAMLPRATNTRNPRDIAKLRQNPRSVEIQRLIGRALRACVDFDILGERSILIDCDVIQADGGTRTAAINGGYVALFIACQKLVQAGTLKKNPIISQVAAISAGVVDGTPMLDLCYTEDSSADVDFNVVMNSEGKFIEMQGTGEHACFDMEELRSILSLTKKGCYNIFALQKQIISDNL